MPYPFALGQENFELNVVKTVVSLALEKGIVINGTDQDGNTVLNGSRCKNITEFLKSGANLDIRRKDQLSETYLL